MLRDDWHIGIDAEFARKHELPFIDDCYSLKVVGTSVYVSYYSDFPLVWLVDFQLQRVWDRHLGRNPSERMFLALILPVSVPDTPNSTVRKAGNGLPVQHSGHSSPPQV